MPHKDTHKPIERAPQRYQTHHGCSVDHFSNTSEDAYGLQGAFAEIADSIDKANNYIFIAGWMFEPWIHLPCYGEHLRQALTLHHQGKLEEAIEKYNHNITTGIDGNGYAAFFLARAYYKLGNRKEAKEILEQALKKHPNHRDISLSLARLDLEEGELEEAKSRISTLLKKHDLDAFSILAEYFHKKGDDDCAKKVYETILRLDPAEQISKARLAYQGLGAIYLRQKKYQEAEDHYRRCLWFYPQDVHSLIGLAKTLSLNPDKANSSITQIDICYYEALGYLRNQPGHENSLIFKNTIKDYALWAVDHIMIDSSEKFNAYYELIRHAIELNPNEPQLFLSKIQFLLKNSDISGGIDELLDKCSNYLKKAPENIALHQAMIQIAEKCADGKHQALILKHRTLIDLWGSPTDKAKLPKVDALLGADGQCIKEDLKTNPEVITQALTLCDLPISDIENPYHACLTLAAAYTQSQYNNQIGEKIPQTHSLLPLQVTLIKKLKELHLNLEQQRHTSKPVPEDTDFRSFNIMDFDEGMREYRETLPSLGETLIRKALANPDMVIAINLWQQQTRPGEVRRFKFPIKELKKIANDLKLPFPPNILIRTNHCRDFFNSHHQKYIVMDDGRGDNTAYVGSCDLSGKFEWADHPIINTAANDNAIDRYYLHHGGESMRYASRNIDLPPGANIPFYIPRGPWREVMTRLRGPVCNDLLKEFKGRWIARSGGALSGHKGSDDDENLVAEIGTTRVYGSLDIKQRVRMKIEEVLNKLKIQKNRRSWNEHVEKYEQMRQSVPGNTMSDLENQSLMHTPKMKKMLQELYKDAYQRYALYKKELVRLKKKYPANHQRITETELEFTKAKEQMQIITKNHLRVLFDTQKQAPDARPPEDNLAACCTRVICSTQKAYYGKHDWQTSHNVDSSIQDAYIQAINNAAHFIYIENQYFSCDHTKIGSNPIIKAMIDKIVTSASENKPFHIYLNLPYSPNGEPGDGLFIDTIRKTQLEIFEYMMKTIGDITKKPWSEFLSINFFAQWNGVDESRVSRLTDGKEISRVESQSISRRAPIYNHSKLLIADGTTIINGSANISERSLSGTSDTELAIIQTPDHEKPQSKRKMEDFMLKILSQYYGDEVATAAKQRLDSGQNLGLEQPEILARIQKNTWDNLCSFSSNEPGQYATRDKGYAVAFPYKRDKEHAGEIDSEFEFIPDAPRDADGNSPDAFRWLPTKELPLSLSLARATGKTS